MIYSNLDNKLIPRWNVLIFKEFYDATRQKRKITASDQRSLNILHACDRRYHLLHISK